MYISRVKINNLFTPEMAYLMGVFQSDGCLYLFRDHKRNKKAFRLNVCGNLKSLPMIIKFRDILCKYFDKRVSIEKRENLFRIQTSINSILHYLSEIGINSKSKFPEWVTSDIKSFSAYIAGIVDGDGNICIKRPLYPQCRIRITNDKFDPNLIYNIEKLFCCETNTRNVFSNVIIKGREVNGKVIDLDFYVSRKNVHIIKQFVYPFIQIVHKREALENYFNYLNSN